MHFIYVIQDYFVILDALECYSHLKMDEKATMRG